MQISILHLLSKKIIIFVVNTTLMYNVLGVAAKNKIDMRTVW